MPDTVIKVENLGKLYVIDRARTRGLRRYSTIRESMVSGLASFGRRMLGRSRDSAPPRDEFWALKDVSFEVQRGEVLGIIGRNGAGKSTLLKVLSRITEPTTGRIELDGRVASLLEVGTGFHPELTGRENINLNGAILGMTRAEIRRKFDEIVAFAEVERFLDTPVKRYSSGMYMRLAFAVAAHLEPEILIVDEVLAVGDAQFQNKCLGKMQEASRGGRTVLFVSHNMASVLAMCDRAILLQRGRIVLDGPANHVAKTYLAERRDIGGAGPQQLGGGIALQRINISPDELCPTDSVEITVELSTEAPVRLSDLALIVYSGFDVRVGIIDFRPRRPPHGIAFSFRLLARCRLTALRLVEGEYRLGLYLVTAQSIVNAPDVARLTVNPSTFRGDFVSYPPEHRGVTEFDYAVEELCSDTIYTADRGVYVTT